MRCETTHYITDEYSHFYFTLLLDPAESPSSLSPRKRRAAKAAAAAEEADAEVTALKA